MGRPSSTRGRLRCPDIPCSVCDMVYPGMPPPRGDPPVCFRCACNKTMRHVVEMLVPLDPWPFDPLGRALIDAADAVEAYERELYGDICDEPTSEAPATCQTTSGG